MHAHVLRHADMSHVTVLLLLMMMMYLCAADLTPLSGAPTMKLFAR
jgi:hypothetical protein